MKCLVCGLDLVDPGLFCGECSLATESYNNRMFQMFSVLQAQEAESPLQRYLRALGPDARKLAVDVIRRREEFMIDVQRAFAFASPLCSNPHEAMHYAERIAKNVTSVVAEWGILQRNLQQWMMYDCPPIKIPIGEGPYR